MEESLQETLRLQEYINSLKKIKRDLMKLYEQADSDMKLTIADEIRQCNNDITITEDQIKAQEKRTNEQIEKEIKKNKSISFVQEWNSTVEPDYEDLAEEYYKKKQILALQLAKDAKNAEEFLQLLLEKETDSQEKEKLKKQISECKRSQEHIKYYRIITPVMIQQKATELKEAQE